MLETQGGAPATPDERRLTVNTRETLDNAAAVRHARFGKLPERIRYEEMVEEKAVTAQDDDRYNPEASFNHFNCLALDLGL